MTTTESPTTLPRVEHHLGSTILVRRRSNGQYAAQITGPDGQSRPAGVAFKDEAIAWDDARREVERGIEDAARAAKQ